MSNQTYEETLNIADKLLGIIDIDLSDELQRQILASYIFGMLNAKARKESLSANDIYTLMIQVAINKLHYTIKQVSVLIKFLVKSKNESYHPTMNAIMQRGNSAYLYYLKQEYQQIKFDIQNIFEVVLAYKK